ncbi:hypothetical protein ACTRW9_10350 [Nitrospina sp. 32_T5]|uniref:hypothetical protein n=1 Tax=unclassified Nitrospina TaxID=2638683 RepID=UPI003F94D427
MEKRQREKLTILNPNKKWVEKEFEALFKEWLEWEREVDGIGDHPIPNGLDGERWKDGLKNIEYHEILQEKTLVFLENNIQGHGFIYGREGGCIDREDLRLKIRVSHRIKDLKLLKASLKYAQVPESYWQEKAKELIEKIIETTGAELPRSTIQLAASYLKNPGD